MAAFNINIKTMFNLFKYITIVGETLGKPNHFTIVMGDFNAQIGKRTNPMETARSKFGLGLKKETGDTLVEWATSRKYNNHEYHVREKSREEMDVEKTKRSNEDRN